MYIYISPNRIISVFMKAIIECVTRNNNIYPMGIKRELILDSSQMINVELGPYFNLAHQSPRLMTVHGKWNRLIAYSQTQKSMVHTEHTLWYLIPIEWFGAPHIYVQTYYKYIRVCVMSVFSSLFQYIVLRDFITFSSLTWSSGSCVQFIYSVRTLANGDF